MLVVKTVFLSESVQLPTVWMISSPSKSPFSWLMANLFVKRPGRSVKIIFFHSQTQPRRAHWLKQFLNWKKKKNPSWRLISIKNINNGPISSRVSFQSFVCFLMLWVEENLSSLQYQPKFWEYSKALSPLSLFQLACTILSGSSQTLALMHKRRGIHGALQPYYSCRTK